MIKRRRCDANGAKTSPPATGGVAATMVELFAQPEPVTEAKVMFLVFDSEMAAATATITRLKLEDPDTNLARIIDRTIVTPVVFQKLSRDGVIGFLALVHVLLRDHWEEMQARLLGPAGAPYLRIIGILQQTLCPRQIPAIALDPMPDPDQLYMLTALEGARSVHRRLPDNYLQKFDFVQLFESQWIVDILGLFLFQLPAAETTRKLMAALLARSACEETDSIAAMSKVSCVDVRLLEAWRRAIQQVFFTGQAPTDSSDVVLRAYALCGPTVRRAVFDADAVDHADKDDDSVDAAATLRAAAGWLNAICVQSANPNTAQWLALNSCLALDVVMTLRSRLDKPEPGLEGDDILIAARAMRQLSTALSDFLGDDPATPVQQFHATLLQAQWNSSIARADARALEAKLCVDPQCMNSANQRRAAFGRLARVVCAAALITDIQISKEIVAFVDIHLVPYFLLSDPPEELTRRLAEFNTAVLVRALVDGHTIIPFLANNLSYFREFASCQRPTKPLAADYICAVCLDADDGQREFLLTQCGHVFHCACLALVTATAVLSGEVTACHARCPCCRTILVTTS